ncbi:MAG: histidine phosphatase family protein [Meiothermus silvanus]|nr:histidine phosphatase family protein [Allomeiothermus silvanus]
MLLSLRSGVGQTRLAALPEGQTRLEDTAPEGRKDDARPLSEEGVRRFRQVVKGLDRLEVRFSKLYHSPKLRAVQTADLLMKLVDGESEVMPALAEPPQEILLAALAGFGKEDRVGMVGHEPWLSELCAWLVLGDRQKATAFILKKGGIARLEGEPEPGKMQLLALLPPSVLRAI